MKLPPYCMVTERGTFSSLMRSSELPNGAMGELSIDVLEDRALKQFP